MSKAFTDTKVRNLKPRDERYMVWEENSHGHGTLGVRIFPTGRKSWVVMYYFEGRPRMMTLGSYPKLTVAGAHKAHADAVGQLEKGEDPGVSKVADNRALALASTVKELAKEYLEKWAKPRKRSWEEDQRILEKDVLPVWGHKKAQNVTRRDVVALLDDIMERGAPIAANRTLALVRKMFNFAVSRDILQRSPCAAVAAPAKENSRKRVLDEQEIRSILTKLPTAKMLEPSKLALRFQLLTAQRCGEVLNAEWSEINTDFGWWTIPASKAKNGLEHRVPLSTQALEVLEAAERLSRGEAYVFPSPRGDQPMTPTALARAVNRNLKIFGVEPWTPHDLRRTATSYISHMGYDRTVMKKILNHADRDVTAVYDRYSYDSPKKQALEAWGQKILEISQFTPTLQVAKNEEAQTDSKPNARRKTNAKKALKNA